MKLNILSIRQYMFTALIHGAASAVVILVNWESIENRLVRETISILIFYTIFSLVLLVLIPFFKKKNYVIAWMTVLPYLAVSLASAVVVYLFITNRPATSTPFEIFPIIVITLFVPYLAIWGPIISVINLSVTYLIKNNEKI